MRALGIVVILGSVIPDCGLEAKRREPPPDPAPIVAPSDSGPSLGQLYPPSAARWDKIQSGAAPLSDAGISRDAGKRSDAAASGSTPEYDRALDLIGVDPVAARQQIEPKVMAGKGTPDEVRLLQQLCRAQADKACVEATQKKYPKAR